MRFKKGNAESSLKMEIVDFLTSHQLFLNGNENGRKASFMHINFEGFDFSNFDISKIVFKNCNLSGITISQNFEEVFFDNCDFTNSNILSKNIKKTTFEDCKFHSTNFANTSIEECLFTKIITDKAILTNSSFYKSKFYNSSFFNTDLTSINIQECIVQMSEFTLCNLPYSKFVKTNLKQVNFIGCDLHSCYFLYSTIHESAFNSFQNEKSGICIKTSIQNAAFEECKFAKTKFEEKKENLLNMIVKKGNKSKKLDKHFFTIAFSKICSVILSFAFLILVFNNQFVVKGTSLLSVSILISFFAVMQNVSFKKISLKQHFIFSRKTFFLVPVILSFVSLFFIWQLSLQFEDFNLSFAILSLFFISSLNSYSYIKSIKSFINQTYKTSN